MWFQPLFHLHGQVIVTQYQIRTVWGWWKIFYPNSPKVSRFELQCAVSCCHGRTTPRRSTYHIALFSWRCLSFIVNLRIDCGTLFHKLYQGVEFPKTVTVMFLANTSWFLVQANMNPFYRMTFSLTIDVPNTFHLLLQYSMVGNHHLCCMSQEITMLCHMLAFINFCKHFQNLSGTKLMVTNIYRDIQVIQ